MKKQLSKDNLERVLSLLGDRLRLNQAPHVELIICGGSALIALNLIRRSTQDVDIVAVLSPDKIPQKAKPLPEFVTRAAEQVAQDFQLDVNWLNNEPTDLLDWGFPDGLLSRLHSKNFGQALTIHFIDRLDQIHFKLYAAVDQGPGRHLGDLLALSPTRAELEKAAKWVVTHDQSEGFLQLLKEMLQEIGYEEVAKTI